MKDEETVRDLLAKAEHARGHAKRLVDEQAVAAIRQYADEIEAHALALQKKIAAATLPETAAEAPTGGPSIRPDLMAAAKKLLPSDDQS